MQTYISRTFLPKNARSLSITALVLILLLSKNTSLAVSNDWNHGCTRSYDQDGKMVLDMPHQAKTGDLLLLFLSRTDDLLPLELNGWKYAASCFKSKNGQKQCWTINDCVKRKNDYCKEFPKGKGRDLATIVYFKTWDKKDPSKFKYDLAGNHHAAWGFLLAVNGIVDHSKPIRDRNTRSRDDNKNSIFPTVNGKAGDLLLLSMAFDDRAEESDFRPPIGTDFVDFVNGRDEAGYLFSKELSSNDATGEFTTGGKGGPSKKDALSSVVLKGSRISSSSEGKRLRVEKKYDNDMH